MHQMENTISISLIILTLGIFTHTSTAQEDSVNPLEDSVFDSDRSRDSGLAKRVYDYLLEYKRYPLYDFGLGKRSSHQYSFGLGKREDSDDLEEYDEYSYNEEDDHIPELELYPDDVMQDLNKRQKLYSFGLGKRLHKYDFGLGKRSQVYKYDFGLGKRSHSSVNRDKLYNFGLGKRNRIYSFGLGKRPYHQGSASGRFNFGLGKRSENGELSKNIIAKRDIHEGNPIQTITKENDRPKDYSQTSTMKTEKLQSGKIESHDINKAHLIKRSPYRYPEKFRSNSGFFRQFRKPMYNFGLGKRMPSSNNKPIKNTISKK